MRQATVLNSQRGGFNRLRNCSGAGAALVAASSIFSNISTVAGRKRGSEVVSA
jgi:hypothetical protein